ncbi:pyridoxal-dependent decarboxylase [Chromatiales bacterium (ex Bugula neritina AB1)]|nr:pyridoxal-dependent decarboxylase [Chromatiales bacterium (ex Bugula neritina AB1)]
MSDKYRTEMQQQMQSGVLFDQAADFGKEYLKGVHARHVAPQPGDLNALSVFDEPLPENKGNAQEILETLYRYGSPGTMAQTGGRFFGLVNGSVIPTSLAARILGDTWDQNAVLHAVSPTNARLEDVCQSWLRDILGLPDNTVAGYVSGTSMAIVCGLAAARYRICSDNNWNVNEQGLDGAPEIRIVTSRHTHSTVSKAIALLGFGTSRIEWVDVDDQGRLLADALPVLDEKTILILQAGNVNSGSFDPIQVCCAKARKAGAWVHIDGAFGLWAAACEKLGYLTEGLAQANSWSVDAHKTLNTPYDNGICLCADPEALVKAMQNSAAYIMYSEHRDGMLYTPEMSRRARAIELWAAIKYLGRDGIDSLVYGLHERACQFSSELKQAGFNVVNDVVYNQVLVSCGDEATTNRIVQHIQGSGEAWVGGSTWFDEPVIRISVCSWATTEADISRAVAAFVHARNG